MQEVESIKKDNPSLIRHKGIIKKLWCDPLALAFFFNLLALLLRLFFFNIKYESSDDYMTDALLSGAFGNGFDPNLLFGNPILGHFLVLLYRLVLFFAFDGFGLCFSNSDPLYSLQKEYEYNCKSDSGFVSAFLC